MNFWLAVYRLACVAFGVILIIGVIVLFLPKIRQYHERQRKVAILEEENRMKEDMVKQLRKQEERFVTDPKYVERVAREELGKAKPGETIFRFMERKTNDYRIRR